MALDDYSPQSAGRAAARAARRRGGKKDSDRPRFSGGRNGRDRRDNDRNNGGRPSFSGGQDRRDSDRHAIGVPDDWEVASTRNLMGMGARAAEGWAAQGMGHGSPAIVRARYFDGDEFKMANVSSDSIVAIKKAMFNAGLISQKDINGAWDYSTAAAYRDVLSYANARGISDQQALTELSMAGLSSGAGAGGGGREDGGGGVGGGIIGYDPETGEPIMTEFQAPPLELRTTNKKDLAKVLRESAVTLTGQGWTEAQINELVDAYNWQEIKVQKDAYAQDVARLKAEFMGEADPFAGKETLTDEQPGGAIDVPSPDTFFEEEIKKRDPGGYQATQVYEDYAPMFYQALGAAGGMI